MNKPILQSIIVAAVLSAMPCAALAKSDSSEQLLRSGPTVAAERLDYHLELVSARQHKAREFEIHEPGASFIKLHFSHFQLSRGMEVEVRNPQGTESYRYSADSRHARTFEPLNGDNGKSSFSAMSISGDTVIVRIHDKSARKSAGASAEPLVVIDSVMVGLSETTAASAQSDAAQT